MTAILYRKAGEWRVPFVVRRADAPSHPGQVALPGGGLHQGEDAWAAAAREAEEEIGVDGASLQALGAGPPVYAAISNYSVVPFIAWLAHEPEPFAADPGELTAVLEVPLDRLLDRAAWHQNRPWPGPNLPVDGQVIWGLTAGLLAGLLPAIAAARAEDAGRS
ncbi:MAG TPA: NUDIX domain-containing protein [Candidatus Dormibacteraeota bacterium]|nr:NUDIX domain-containing protein [Candidatus Dormibacteraeota bacterium]